MPAASMARTLACRARSLVSSLSRRDMPLMNAAARYDPVVRVSTIFSRSELVNTLAGK